MGRVEHHIPGVLNLRSQFGPDSGEYPYPALPLPEIAERLDRALGRRCVLAHQPIAVYPDHPARDPQIINPRLAT